MNLADQLMASQASKEGKLGRRSSTTSSGGKSGDEDKGRKGFRRSLSNLQSSLRQFGAGPSEVPGRAGRQSAQVDRGISNIPVASSSTQTLDAAPRTRKLSARLSTLREWGSTGAGSAQAPATNGMVRSPSSRNSFTAGLRSLKQRASEFGALNEQDGQETGFQSRKKAQSWLGPLPGAPVTRARDPESEPESEPSAARTDADDRPRPSTPPTINVGGLSEPVLRDSPKKPSIAPRLSFGGNHLVDDDWGELSPTKASSDSPFLEAQEGRRVSQTSDVHSTAAPSLAEVAEIRETHEVKPAQASLVTIADGQKEAVPVAFYSPPASPRLDVEYDKSLPAPPSRLMGRQISASSLKKAVPVRRLLSSDSWKKLSLSASDMSPTRSATSIETEKPLASPTSPGPVEQPALGGLEPPGSRPLSRSGTQTSFAETSGSLTRSYSGRSLTNRLTTPSGRRGSFGQVRYDSVSAIPFSRKEQSAAESLHRLSMGSSPMSGVSNRSSPTADRIVT